MDKKKKVKNMQATIKKQETPKFGSMLNARIIVQKTMRDKGLSSEYVRKSFEQIRRGNKET
jgi:hypothetical protein